MDAVNIVVRNIVIVRTIATIVCSVRGRIFGYENVCGFLEDLLGGFDEVGPIAVRLWPYVRPLTGSAVRFLLLMVVVVMVMVITIWFWMT